MDTTSPVQHAYLETLIKQPQLSHIFLRNGIKLSGKIIAQQANAIFMQDTDLMPMMIFKANISTVAPTGRCYDDSCLIRAYRSSIRS